jgi:hypothetical protein
MAARPTLEPPALEQSLVRPMVLQASLSAALFGLAHPTVKGSLLE